MTDKCKEYASDSLHNDLLSECDEFVNLEGLSEEKLKTFAENWRLISLIEQGFSIKDAKSKLQSPISERSIRNIVKRYKTYGQKGLIDQRWNRSTPTLVLTSEVKNIILGYYYSYPAAGARLIWRKICTECQIRELRKPSESSVRKFLASLSEPLKMFRFGKTGIKKWEQTAAPVIRYENTTYSNERWQGDHSPLPIWVRVKENDSWIPQKAYISAFLDAHSRAVPGYIVSCKYPDSWTKADFRYLKHKE